MTGENRRSRTVPRSRPTRARRLEAARAPGDVGAFLSRLHVQATRGIPRAQFLAQVAQMLLEFSGCDWIELRHREAAEEGYRCQMSRGDPMSFRFEREPHPAEEGVAASGGPDAVELLCARVTERRFDAALPCFTPRGSFWTGDVEEVHALIAPAGGGSPPVLGPDFGFRSLAIIPLTAGSENTGLLQMRNSARGFFTRADMRLYEQAAASLGVALSHQRARWALGERVKELTCLYGIAQVAERPGITLEEMLKCIAELLPPGWQYPSECSARIVLDGRPHARSGFREGPHRQAADIVVDGLPRGSVEVFYTEEKPPLDEGPFLREERSLIHEVARQVALILSRRQAETEKARLQEQLRHADRLVTIGQLAAGAAHELNEPLGGILGFAQLAGKHERLPPEVRRDLEKIVRSALHARDVVRKLMLFARQTPPRKMRVDLNRLVAEGIMFVEPRFAAEGIVLRRKLATDLPEIVADPGQMHQVIVNLVVNGLQSMPDGGTLTIETRAGQDHVVLAVEDAGTGMTADVLERVFMPFFTTKDVGQGTGLGLSMVHGIVTSHGGSIRVDSKPGRGSRFEVRLPRRSAGDAANGEGNGAVDR